MLHYQGVPGSYSHAASLHFSKKMGSAESATKGYDNFDLVWSAITGSEYAVLPIENSYAGPIHINMYQFLKHEYHILDERYQPINHCLIGHHTDISKITDVWSHPQALAQCYEFCKKYGIIQHEAADTAGSVQEIAKGTNHSYAAIGSALSAELYGLEIIQESIQDNSKNTTRFFVVGDKKKSQGTTKSILLFSIRNGQGVLYKCLGAFATHGIDLTKIESLPSKQDPFTYYFWVECTKTSGDPLMKEALRELEFYTKEVRILGEL